MKLQKLIATGLVCVTLTACIAGCGTAKKEEANNGKVKITVGYWPEKGTKEYDTKQEQIAKFNEKYPDIEVVGDPYAYSIDTFTAKATAR